MSVENRLLPSTFRGIIPRNDRPFRNPENPADIPHFTDRSCFKGFFFPITALSGGFGDQGQ